MGRISAVLVIFLAARVVSSVEMTATECEQAGFHSATLDCASCAQLPKFDLDLLVTDCQACCTTRRDSSAQKRYPSAVLEVCECNLGRFPQVQAFVREDMALEWGTRVKVRHVRGVLPTLILQDEAGDTAQTLNVQAWDTDTIKEFLQNSILDD